MKAKNMSAEAAVKNIEKKETNNGIIEMAK
jgi:hypothetical protein